MDLQSKLMSLERRIDDLRSKQRRAVLETIRDLQMKYKCRGAEITVAMEYDPAEGYSCYIDQIAYPRTKMPRQWYEFREELAELLSDNTFIFAGLRGAALITDSSEDILFET